MSDWQLNKTAADIAYDIGWFVFSTLLLSWLLPRVIDWRRFKKQVRIRRLIASRISRAQFTLEQYLRSYGQASDLQVAWDGREEARDLKNAVYHLLGIASQFSFALDGPVGEAYFQYRIAFTNVAVNLTKRFDQFDDLMESMFFTNVDTPEGSIAGINRMYKICISTLGPDIEGIATLQGIVAPLLPEAVLELDSIYARTRQA